MREEEREKEKHQCEKNINRLPYGMCPDRESNQQLFALQDSFQSTERPGQC